MRDLGKLVEGDVRRYGRLSDRPATLNPLDEFGGLSRALHRLRLKEWVGFTLLHPDMYASLIMQDAQYLASSEIYAYLSARSALFQHAANARGGSLNLPAGLAGSHPAFDRRGYRLEYEFAGTSSGRHTLRFDIAATDKAPAFQGELELDAAKASAPLSVSSRLPGGRMYTHKAIYPAEGVIRVGDQKVAFEGARDLAILDEHKSLLPYRTTWLWGTFALRVAGGIAGANFADRPSIPGDEEESCIWTPGACDPLADIEFRQQGHGTGAPWQICSRDGRLDVIFEPEGRKQVRHQLGIFAVDYFQLFGHYRGTLRGADRTYEIHDVHGVCESMRARL
ncbi:MAG TPA: DUF2804 family protein [Streptosporangiaceae bacterium]|nr:DUF2804 family protein [Streptosporangiaceae bacterium]